MIRPRVSPAQARIPDEPPEPLDRPCRARSRRASWQGHRQAIDRFRGIVESAEKHLDHRRHRKEAGVDKVQKRPRQTSRPIVRGPRMRWKASRSNICTTSENGRPPVCPDTSRAGSQIRNPTAEFSIYADGHRSDSFRHEAATIPPRGSPSCPPPSPFSFSSPRSSMRHGTRSSNRMTIACR